MNNRTLLIIAGLALPLVALVILAQTGAQQTPASQTAAVTSGAGAPTAKSAPASKPGQAAKSNHTFSIPPVKLPSTEGNATPNLEAKPTGTATSLEEAKQRLRKRLAELETMTSEQFQEEQEMKAAKAKWDSLTPQQKLKVLQKRNEELEQQAQKKFNEPMPAAGTSGPAASADPAALAPPPQQN